MGKLEESDKITVELTSNEMRIIINALGSKSPESKEDEAIQFRLYHTLVFKLNSVVKHDK